LDRRFAARSNTSRAHVTGFSPTASAASCIWYFSSAVIGSFIDSVRRSSGAFGGRPVLGMTTNHTHEKFSVNPDSLLIRLIYYAYNKLVIGNRFPTKNPGSAETPPGRQTIRRFRPNASLSNCILPRFAAIQRRIRWPTS